MYFASSADIAFAPSALLHNYLADISFLPFRQMELFAASLFPDIFGLRANFNPARYVDTRSDFTTDFRGLNGELVNMEAELSAAKLRADHQEFKELLHVHRLPRLAASVIDADERDYLDKIAQLASAHGAKLLMLYVPDFDSGKLDEGIRKHYGRYGTVLDNSDLATRNTLFMHWGHLNHAGAMVLSDRIADAVASQLSAVKN